MATRGHHQPAQNHRAVGPAHGPSQWPTPSSGKTAAPPPRCDELRRQGRGQPDPARPGWCWTPIFGHQAAVVAGPNARAPACGTRRRAGLRHGGQLADLEPDAASVHATMRATPRAPCLQPAHAAVGRRTAAPVQHPAQLLPPVVPSSGVLGHHPGVLAMRPAHCRRRGRPAGRHLWPGLLCTRHGQEHYGTGCFMLMNTGDAAVPSRNRLLTTSGWQGPVGSRRPRYRLLPGARRRRVSWPAPPSSGCATACR